MVYSETCPYLLVINEAGSGEVDVGDIIERRRCDGRQRTASGDLAVPYQLSKIKAQVCEFEVQPGPYMPFRITSYNVCYTKLLRTATRWIKDSSISGTTKT